MFTAFFTKAELYPFAPYMMYSKKMDFSELHFIRVFMIDGNGKEIPLENKYIQPFDEARLSERVNVLFWDGEHDKVSKLPKEIFKRIQHNAAKYGLEMMKGVAIKRIHWRNVEEYFQDKKAIDKTEFEYIFQ